MGGEDKHQLIETTNHRFLLHHPTSSIDFILSFSTNLPRNFTPNEVSMLPLTDYVFRSGSVYIGGFGSADNEEPAAADVHGLIRGEGGAPVARGRRERAATGLLVAVQGSGKARSNDVCLALEERPLAGLEDTGFGTKMMAKG